MPVRAAALKLPPPQDPHEFDRIVEEVLRVRHKNNHLTRYGRPGQRQHGIDGRDPLAGARAELVWQSTIGTSDLLRKLDSDLGKLDRSGIRPSLFIYAVTTRRDAVLQDAVKERSDRRCRRSMCPIEVLFWEELESYLVRDVDLGSTWYPEYFDGDKHASASRGQETALQLIVFETEAPPTGRTTHQRTWYMVHLASMCHVLSNTEMAELRGAAVAAELGTSGPKYWSTGGVAAIGDNWNYPNGKTANIGENWCYPNGKTANIGENWYYPNGKTANIGDTWYFPNGNLAGTEAATISTGIGSMRSDHQRTIVSRLRDLRGQARRLAVIELAWFSSSGRVGNR